MDLRRNAAILIDFQNEFFHSDGLLYRLGLGRLTSGERATALQNAKLVIHQMKAAGRPVVWLKTVLRPDHMDSAFPLMTRDQGLNEKNGFLAEGSWGAEIVDGVMPGPDDLVLVKKGQSAFQFTYLDRLLANLGVKSCVMLGGGLLDGLPESVRQGGALGYEIVIPADATGYPPGSSDLQNLWNRALIMTTQEIPNLLSQSTDMSQSRLRTALLLIDLQNDFLHPDGFQHRLGYAHVSDEERSTIIRNNQRLLQIMGEAGEPIIFTMTTYRRDKLDDAAPPIALKNKPVPADDTFLLEGSWGEKIVRGLETQKGDFIITKKGRSAFGFTPLHRILRNLNVNQCIVTGGGIHGCVEDTIREGVGLGYTFTVVKDAIYEPNSPNLKVMAYHARFSTTDEVLAERLKEAADDAGPRT